MIFALFSMFNRPHSISAEALCSRLTDASRRLCLSRNWGNCFDHSEDRLIKVKK